jgi:hypothetical protein
MNNANPQVAGPIHATNLLSQVGTESRALHCQEVLP